MSLPVFGGRRKSKFSKDPEKDGKLKAGIADKWGLQRWREDGPAEWVEQPVAGLGVGGSGTRAGELREEMRLERWVEIRYHRPLNAALEN